MAEPSPRPSFGSFALIVLLGLAVLISIPIASGTNSAALVATVFFFGGALVLYVAPSIVAGTRHHPNGTSIIVLNLLLGWTILGWVGALVWAYSSGPQPETPAQPAVAPVALAPPSADAAMRDCPYCAEPVRAAAIKCKHCGSDLTMPASV